MSEHTEHCRKRMKYGDGECECKHGRILYGSRCLTCEKEKREELAKYAHAAWSGWMKYMFENSLDSNDGMVVIPGWAVNRWKRQMNTEYEDLPEEEKESDRKEADEMLEIVKKFNTHKDNNNNGKRSI